ncbi:MAG TPA: glycosyltransferase family 4 protein [Solirubrobacteraceae bacterium]|nr:glycosyltransferase family 4 protein [Solirubrobacteraceae bacterium]
MRGRTLLLSENAPVPADRRVWNECRTLAAAEWEVVVACAGDPDGSQPAIETLEGVEIRRYPLTPSAGGAAGYVREYGEAAIRLRRLVRRLARERRFDVIHAANPPDFLLATAADLKRRGARLVFDHHDLMPELFRARYGGGAPHGAMLAVERMAFALADVVISTNASYRQVAIDRGRKHPSDVFVVRNGPDLDRFVPVAPDPALRRGRPHLLAYLGIMGRQDGIDEALHALAWLYDRRDDWHATFVGRGDVLEEMRALSESLGIAGHVEFTGWRGDDDIRRILSTADVCIAPDPPNPLNDVSTMIKIPEYLAMGCAVVSYDLRESRVSAGTAALYAQTSDPASLGRCIEILLDDPERRARMGREGVARVRRELAWQHSAPVLRAAYERAMTRPRRVRRPR